MPPSSGRDFLKAAAQRLTAAEHLLRGKLTLDAQYLAGYTVECSLKALILQMTPMSDQPRILSRITSGAVMHRPDVLVAELRTLEVSLPLELTKRFRRFNWSTDLRYESARQDYGETMAILNTAKAVYTWVEEQLR